MYMYTVRACTIHVLTCLQYFILIHVILNMLYVYMYLDILRYVIRSLLIIKHHVPLYNAISIYIGTSICTYNEYSITDR